MIAAFLGAGQIGVLTQKDPEGSLECRVKIIACTISQ
jgi:hypothetical protein